MPCAHAQNIDRVKLTDNDLTCRQIYVEIAQMDAVIAQSGGQPVAVAPAAAAPVDNTAGQVAGAVAQVAITNAAVRSGFGGFGGFGGLGGMFGGVAQQAQLAQQQQDQQQAQQQAMLQQQQMAMAQQGAVRNQQAQGRKDHLSALFLSKGCKLADVQ